MSESILNKELCFQLYIASKEVIKLYKPFLEKYDLTYTGFITMLAVKNQMTVNELGESLFLDSGTLSPLLKKLEKKGYIQKVRSKEDERRVELFLTQVGENIQKELPCVSQDVADSMDSNESFTNYEKLVNQLFELNQLFKTKKKA